MVRRRPWTDAREYQPATGTFTSADRLLSPYDPQDLNPYSYAYDDPATEADPTGLLGSYEGAEGGLDHNDEALEGIFPGLRYAFYEIVDSDWNERLTEQNRITFAGRPNVFNRRHFLMTCHETTLQVLASDLVMQGFDEPFADVAARVLRSQLDSEDITVTPRINE